MRRFVTISGTEETVLKPIVNSVSKDIIDILKLNINSDFVVMYNEIPILKEFYSGPSTQDKSLKSNILEVSVKEEPIQELELTRIPVNPDSVPFFKDEETNTKATTGYRSIKLNFNFSLRSKSRSYITKVLDLLHILKIDGAMHNYHNIQISYQLPNITKKFIKEIIDIKNSYEPLTISDFMDKTFNKNYLDSYLSLDGDIEKNTLSIKEYQSDVLGYFVGEFTEVEKEKDGIYYSINLNYIIQYQKPISVHMEFPYLIYNKRLSKLFVSPPKDYIERHFRNHEKELISLLTIHQAFGINKQGYYLTYPRDDEFNIRDPLYGYCPIISLLCIVNKNDPTDLFNIDNMGTIQFLDVVSEFIKLQKDYVTKYQGSLFYFALYENDCIKSNNLSMDELGNLKTLKDMDIRNTYRVVISICSDISIVQYPNRQVIIDFLNENIRNGKGTLLLDSYLSFFKVELSKVFETYNKQVIKNPGGLLIELQLPDFSWPKLSNQHHTEVYRLLKDK